MKKEVPQKLKSYRLIMILTTLLGILLMAYMITVESEPGALPLLLILIGVIGLLYLQFKIKKQSN